MTIPPCVETKAPADASLKAANPQTQDQQMDVVTMVATATSAIKMPSSKNILIIKCLVDHFIQGSLDTLLPPPVG